MFEFEAPSDENLDEQTMLLQNKLDAANSVVQDLKLLDKRIAIHLEEMHISISSLVLIETGLFLLL